MKTRKIRVIWMALLVAVVVMLFADFVTRQFTPSQASTSNADNESTVDAPASAGQATVFQSPVFLSQPVSQTSSLRYQGPATPPALQTGRVQSASRSLDQLQQALAGIRLAQDVVLNNIANAGTTGFKRSQVQFTDLAYRQLVSPGAVDEQGQLTPTGASIGQGIRVAGTIVDHGEGSLVQTGMPLHLSIVGDGFFQIQAGNEIAYSRAGNFSTNAEGAIVIADTNRGRLLEPTITIPADAEAIVVASEGSVSVRQAGSQTLTQLGQIQTARFINPQGLIPIGENLYRLSDGSGQPHIGAPGSDGLGPLRSGFLEASNVVVESELIELRRLESHRRAIHYAMELLNPGSPGMSDVGGLPGGPGLLPPQIASDPRDGAASRK